MASLIWNLRGINDPDTRRNVKEAKSNYNISFVGLAELKKNQKFL
jgi:hypothetical protein